MYYPTKPSIVLRFCKKNSNTILLLGDKIKWTLFDHCLLYLYHVRLLKTNIDKDLITFLFKVIYSVVFLSSKIYKGQISLIDGIPVQK